MRVLSRHFLIVAGVLLALASSTARAEDIPLVTGEHWTQSSGAVKKAYLVGIANFLQVETAYGGNAAAGDAQTLVPRMVKGLGGGKQTLDSVRTGLDAWYAKNPGRRQRPVIEVIWFEMTVPGLAKTN